MTMSVLVGPNAVNQFAPKKAAVKRRKDSLEAHQVVLVEDGAATAKSRLPPTIRRVQRETLSHGRRPGLVADRSRLAHTAGTAFGNQTELEAFAAARVSRARRLAVIAAAREGGPVFAVASAPLYRTMRASDSAWASGTPVSAASSSTD